MSHDLHASDLVQRLWKELDAEKFGMLGVVGGAPHHMQPMTVFSDEDNGAVWFYAKKSSDLVRDVGTSHAGMLCLMSKDQDFQACVAGTLSPTHDKAKIDQYWSGHVAAWYPEGKDDPDLTLLRFDLRDAQVWVSKKGPMAYAFEVAKANATGSLPDVGQKGEVRLG